MTVALKRPISIAMLETLEMPIRKRVMEILDQAFEEVEPSGKSAVLALEIQKLVVVPRSLIDDVRHLVQLSKDPDFDINDAKIAIMPIRQAIDSLGQEK